MSLQEVTNKYWITFQKHIPQNNALSSGAASMQVDQQGRAAQNVGPYDRNFIEDGEKQPLIKTANAQNVQLNFGASKVDNIPFDLSADFKEVFANLNSELHSQISPLMPVGQEIDQQIVNLAREEYETWQLVNELVFAENLYFRNQKRQAKDEQECPKTLEYKNLVKNHQSMTVHAVAHWLEKIYDHQSEAQISRPNVLPGRTDFDQNFQQEILLKQDQQCLLHLFDLLRGGRLEDAQKLLLQEEQYEKFLWLIGSIPQLDNTEFVESCEYQSLITTDLDRQQNLKVVSKRAVDCGTQIVTGNRANLLFVETSYEHIKQAENEIRQTDMNLSAKVVAKYENAILGLQCGNLEAVKEVISQGSQRSSRDKLWAMFRTESQKMRLLGQLDQLSKSLRDQPKQQLDEYYSMYSPLLDFEGCKALEAKLHATDINLVHELRDQRSSFFSEFRWFEQIQQEIIEAALSSSQQQSRGINCWDRIIDLLEKQTREESNTEENKVKVRFSAHLAILLVLMNRVSDNSFSKSAYNQILRRYIKQLMEVQNIHDQTKLRQFPFYTALLLGEEEQLKTFGSELHKVSDESQIKQVQGQNKIYFTEKMCQKILKAVPEHSIYRDYNHSSQVFENQLHEDLNFQRDAEMTDEDERTMDVLKWLQEKDDLATVLSMYAELARKFLIERKFKPANQLLSSFMNSNLSAQLKMQLKERESQMLQYVSGDDQKAASEIAYTREISRIKKLTEVLLYGEELISGQNLMTGRLERIKKDCLEMIQSEQLPGPGLMLSDSNDVHEAIPSLANEHLRQKSIDQINMRFTQQVLLNLFEVFVQLKDFTRCISFMGFVRTIQPRVDRYITKDDLATIAKRQTDLLLKSQSVMYELLVKDQDHEEPDSSDADEFENEIYIKANRGN